MKKLLLSCMATFAIFYVLHAQNADFAPLGAKWYYSQTSFEYPYPEEFRVVEVTEEVVFQGKLCRKIEGLTDCGLPNPSHVFTRNDSTFFWSDFSMAFEMLYDFRAEVGDTWLINGLGLMGDSLRVYVEAVGHRVVGSDTLKTWTISQSGCYDWGNEIVERVGNLYFLSPSYCLCENGPYNARCYSDGSAEYSFVSYPCDTVLNWLSITGIGAPLSLAANPNPAIDHAFLMYDKELKGHLGSITLFNRQGVKLREQVFSTRDGQPLRIDLAGLPSGVYVYRLLTDKGEAGTGKLMVK